MPGPGFWRSLMLGFEFKKNYIAPLESLFAEFGDYYTFKGGPPVIVVSHPQGIEHVLKKNHKNYLKPKSMNELRPVLGNGLLTSNGEDWRKHRQIIAPEFQHKKVELLFPIMQRHLQTLISNWRLRSEPFDLAPSISKLTYAIAGESFFGFDVGETSNIIYDSVEMASEVAVRRLTMPLLNLPLSFPLPSHLRLQSAIRNMNTVVYKILEERLHSPSEAVDVLSRLTRARTESGEALLSPTQIRDEVMTLLLAGHETTGNTLAWTLYLLGKNIAVQNKLREEVMSVVADEVPTLSELRRLSYTKMVLEEAMRLYPPAAVIGRQAIEEDEIGGYCVMPHTTVNLPQWVTHRHPDFWSRPSEFIPERFAEPENIHPFAYFPFAAGPRECIGKNMAMVEAIALLAGMVRNFNFQLVQDNVRVRTLITLRPDPGIFMQLSF